MSPGAHESETTVGVDWIRSRLDDPGVRLVEVDVSRAAYDDGHIPGAVLWNAYGDLRDPGYKPIGRPQLADLIAGSGVTRETTLVFYGYGALLGYWLMKAHRHPDVRVLLEPREAWAEAGAEWSTDAREPSAGSYQLRDPDPHLLASREAVEAAIGQPDTVLLDVRSPEEFSGERFWPSGAIEDAGRAGHLPGAVSLSIDLLREESGRLKDPGRFHEALKEREVTPDKNVITYCTIGNRASIAWFALSERLGYPSASVYYGSWVEWGKQQETPIEA